MIERMSEVLNWRLEDDTTDRVYNSYIELLAETLGKLSARIRKEDAMLGERLASHAAQSSDEALLRVLSAPETSYRLLSPRAHKLCDAAAFIEQVFEVEAALSGQRILFHNKTWSALGDLAIYPDGTIYRFPQIEAFMPLDFGSDHARAIDLTGEGTIAQKPNPPFRNYEIELLVNWLHRTRDGIKATSESVLDFVVRFTRVLVLQKDPIGSASFSSGSTRQHIGRSCLGNPQIADEADIANAIVHESIHSLLYMQEVQKAWVFDPDLFMPVPRVVSPWTGKALALRPFLQACFVWYGLLQFWSLALSANAFSIDRARTWILQCLVGFTKGSLLEHIDEHKKSISSDVMEAIQEMQLTVTEAFGSVV